MLNIFITSPEKREGKTFITAGLAATMQSLGYSTSVYKPIQTSGIEINGFMQSPDLTFIKTTDPYINTHFSYLYKENAEPLIASEAENDPIDIDLINNEYKRILASSECLITDGDSGLLTPLTHNIQNVDLIKRLDAPLLIITTPSENCINNTLMTLFSAHERKINIRGVIINNIKPNCPKTLLNSIPRIIEEYSNTKVLGLVPAMQEKFSPEGLITSVLNGIDIESVFDVKIEKLDIS